MMWPDDSASGGRGAVGFGPAPCRLRGAHRVTRTLRMSPPWFFSLQGSGQVSNVFFLGREFPIFTFFLGPSLFQGFH